MRCSYWPLTRQELESLEEFVQQPDVQKKIREMVTADDVYKMDLTAGYTEQGKEVLIKNLRALLGT